MAKRKARDTVECWGWHSISGNHLVVDFAGSATVASFQRLCSKDSRPVRVRVMREADYRRLLKAARPK